MTEQECFEFLRHAALGRLACSHQDQPYVVPVTLAYESNSVYVMSTYGQKIEWMRENPKVCILVDELKGESNWTSVIVQGTYLELVEPRYSDELEDAKKLLERRTRWWLNAFAERQAKSGDTLIEPIFFRVEIDSVSGMKATS